MDTTTARILVGILSQVTFFTTWVMMFVITVQDQRRQQDGGHHHGDVLHNVFHFYVLL